MTQPFRPHVELHALTKAYPDPLGDPVRVVDGFSTRIEEGAFVSVIGHSGCGKSTVLSMVAGLTPITSGSVIIAGREVAGPGTDRAVVFQSPCLLPWMTALENVLLGIQSAYPHASRHEQRQIAEYHLALVGLADAMHKRPAALSGGMQQRVGIARAIALKPRVLLLDEPFGKLDSLTRMSLQAKVLELLDAQRITTLMITHDVDEALFMSDRVLMMTRGPRARIGQVIDLPFARPRDRQSVLGHELYDDFRCCLIDFLEGQDRPAPRENQDRPPTPPGAPEGASRPEPRAPADAPPVLELAPA